MEEPSAVKDEEMLPKDGKMKSPKGLECPLGQCLPVSSLLSQGL
jgi:hypothetical protein